MKSAPAKPRINTYRVGARVRVAPGAIPAALIRAQVGNAIGIFCTNLLEQAEVRGLASEVRERFSRFDVLLNNAGAIFRKPALMAGEIEKTRPLDQLAYVQLSLKLLDLLEASAPVWIVNVASSSHRRRSMFSNAPRPPSALSA